MSCQVKVFANIIDIPGVRRYLFPWDDDRGSENWLSSCLVSISPTGELVVLANNDRIVVLSAKWDSNAVLSQYHISFSGTLDSNPDVITSILCLPIASQSQSSQVGPDWTCIVVGFQTGQVKFYTEGCNLLLTEQFHDEEVKNIKCQSKHFSHVEIGSDFRPEEVYIQYPKCVCVLAGAQLFSTLRNFRSQLAKVQAKGDSLFPSAHLLLHKKWGIFDQFEMNDVAVVGLDAANTFNHLLTASTCGGFDTRYRAMAPNNTLIIGAGSKPYIGFHYALEGGMQPLLSDVAKAVAHKLKSALPGWLVGGKSAGEKPQGSGVQSAEAVGCRFGLCDIRRAADSVIMSPNKKLSVVTDSLGRIALIDNYIGVALRLWKGYRGAQCAFIQVPDEERNRQKTASKRRIALFLVIYTPKKGSLEIWALQQGPKIVTFSASKHSKLIYTNYGVMGSGNVGPKSKQGPLASCFLLDPDGQIKEILVPFHFALSDKNSKRSRDVHLFKRLKQLFKQEDFCVEKLCAEVSSTCSELKTNEIRAQTLELLTAHPQTHPRAVTLITDTFLDLPPQDHSDDTQTLLILCQNLRLLVDFYQFTSEDSDHENGNVLNNNQPSTPPEASPCTPPDTRLIIADKEMQNLQKLLDLSTVTDPRKNSEPKVSFHEDFRSIFPEYLSLFDLSNPKGITLKKTSPEDKIYKVAEQIFTPFILSKRKDTEEFKEQMLRSTIRTIDLIKMALNFWVNRSLDINMKLEEEMQNLSRVLHMICLTTGTENICVEYNKVSPFWTEIREYLADSAKPFPALTAAMLCRSVAQRIEQEKEAQQCSSTSLEDETSTDIWEKLSQENCQWTLLIGKLEDVSLLNIVLSYKPRTDSQVLPKLYYEGRLISLKYILYRGRGAVSELVAQWLASAGISPVIIAESGVREEGGDVREDAEESGEVLGHLRVLRRQFPYSLEPGALLANMAWEYASNWGKDVGNIELLDALERCLRLVSGCHMRQGLYHLLWGTYLRRTFESACKLINKVGKVPKEVLCRQDTGLSDLQLPIFLEFCSSFLDRLLDTIQESYAVSKPEGLQFEGLWDSGGSPLTELALQQCELNDSVVHLHFQLSQIMQMIAVFGVRQQKPVQNLFDPSVSAHFFRDLSPRNCHITAHSTDQKLQRARLTFLQKIIAASIETVQLTDRGVYSEDHVTWMGRCVNLANTWGLDSDVLRRFQTLQLYTNGFAGLAEEILPSVGNTEALAADLLQLAGKQLKKYLMSSEDLAGKVVALSPFLSQFLETLDKNWCAPGTLETITGLAEYSVRYLPETNTNNRLATLLLDACLTLRGMES